MIIHASVSSPPHPGVVALAAGGSHTCALLSGGGIDCWGYNGDVELGTGDKTERLTPTGVPGHVLGTVRYHKHELQFFWIILELV